MTDVIITHVRIMTVRRKTDQLPGSQSDVKGGVRYDTENSIQQ